MLHFATYLFPLFVMSVSTYIVLHGTIYIPSAFNDLEDGNIIISVILNIYEFKTHESNQLDDFSMLPSLLPGNSVLP